MYTFLKGGTGISFAQKLGLKGRLMSDMGFLRIVYLEGFDSMS